MKGNALAKISYSATPIQELNHRLVKEHGLRVIIKREDLNHPFVSGNKWWKLKYNLQEAVRHGHDTLLTFGGAYSNHIFATAAAAKELGLKSIGIIRGEETVPLNHTLAFAKSCGMQLHYVSREAYRKKTEEDFTAHLHDQFGNFYLIPEGGTNELAIKGCAEFAAQLNAEIDFDYLCLPVGTGGTMVGIIAGVKNNVEVIGFSVLKGGEFLNQEISNYLRKKSIQSYGKWRIETSYHHGGYGKTTPELNDFIANMKSQHQLPLDFVYTAKMVFGAIDLIRQGSFERGSTIMLLHTGGLQNLEDLTA
jgi:1-aminocyclopropane-1-carboxylate deaminase